MLHPGPWRYKGVLLWSLVPKQIYQDYLQQAVEIKQGSNVIEQIMRVVKWSEEEIKKNPQPLIITQEEEFPPQPQEVLPPQPQEVQPLTMPIVPLEPQKPQVVIPTEPQEQQQSTTQRRVRRAPNHDPMKWRQSNRLKTKKKQASTPPNSFEQVFRNILIEFVQRAATISLL